MERKYYYISNGKLDRAKVMKNAWRLHRSPLSCDSYRNSFQDCLRESWRCAKRELAEYKMLHTDTMPVHTGYNYGGKILRSTFLSNHPENRYYDSSWR